MRLPDFLAPRAEEIPKGGTELKTKEQLQQEALEKADSEKTKQEQKEKRETCLRSIRNGHSQFDSVSRSARPTLDKAKKHENTQGSKFVSDLEELLKQCKQLDAFIVEQEYVHGLSPLTEQQVEATVDSVTNLMSKVKQIRRFSALLTSLMNTKITEEVQASDPNPVASSS